MITDKIKQLQALRSKTAELERAVAAELRAELAALPSQFGFATTAEFIIAVREAGGGRRGRPKGTNSATKSGARRGPRRRARITDETRAEVKKLVQGGKTGAEIAGTLGISLSSVQNIKKSLGLVGKRKN